MEFPRFVYKSFPDDWMIVKGIDEYEEALNHGYHNDRDFMDSDGHYRAGPVVSDDGGRPNHTSKRKVK